MTTETLKTIQKLMNEIELEKMKNIRLKNALVRRVEVRKTIDPEPIYQFDYPINNQNAL
jgi:ribosome-binding factor A